MKIFIVVAAWNEEKNISRVINGLKKHDYNNVVVVDDGSQDNTSKEALNSGAYVLRHFINRGQGAALQTGNEFALKNDADIIVHFDADGQHLPQEITRLTKPIQEKKVDVVFGSRFLQENTMPLAKKFVLKAGIFFNFIMYGILMTDAHNGFRALSRRAAEKVRITEDKMEHASEIVELVKKYNFKHVEVPVTILPDVGSQSPLNAIKMGFKLLFKKFFS